MGDDFGAIYVKHRARLTQARVVRAIATYWTEAGATRNDTDLLRIEPSSLVNGGSRLGLAVTARNRNWFSILDSERYTACEPLARHLSDSLETEVLVFQIADASGLANHSIYQKGEAQPKADEAEDETTACRNTLDELDLPYFGATFDHLRGHEGREAEGIRVLGFSEVTMAAYVGAAVGDRPATADEDHQARQERERNEYIFEKGWPTWKELTHPDADLSNLSHEFRALLSHRTDLGTLTDLSDFACTLTDLGRHEELLEMCETLLPRIFSLHFWQRKQLGALVGLGRLDDAADVLPGVLFRNIDQNTYLSGRSLQEVIALYACTEQSEKVRILEGIPIEEGRMGPAQKHEVAALLAGELGPEFPIGDCTNEALSRFVEFCDESLGGAEEISTLAHRAAAELAERKNILQGLKAAVAESDLSAIEAHIDRLPSGPDFRICQAVARLWLSHRDVGEPGHRLLCYAMRYPEDWVVDMYLAVLLQLGRYDEAWAAVPRAIKAAERNARGYHNAACAAARTDIELTLELTRRAREFHCPSFPKMRSDPDLAPVHDHPEFLALFQRLETLPIRAYEETIRPELPRKLLVRDHYRVAFLVPGGFASQTASFTSALDAFLELVPDDELTWGMVGANASRANSLKPMDARLLGRCRTHLNPERKASRKRMVFFELFGPELVNPGFAFTVVGWNESRVGVHRNVIWMSFPTEFVEARGVSRFRNWVKDLSEVIDYTYGFVSLVITPWDLTRRDPVLLCRLAGLARWHIGFDTCQPYTSMGDQVPNAKWMNFLDAAKVERLGGLAGVEAGLVEGVLVEPTQNGLLLQAGEAPDRGDMETCANIEEIRSVSTILQPITQDGRLSYRVKPAGLADSATGGALAGYPGGEAAWAKRFDT